MATVTSKTAAYIQAIENAEIVSAHVDGSSHLILVKKDNSTIDAGSIAPSSSIPTGAIVGYGGWSTQIPAGWLLCNGQEVSRTTYSALFAVIDTGFGSGNGTTTFNVPDFNGRYPRMEINARGHIGGADTHSHTIADHFHNAHDHHLDGGDPVGFAKIYYITGPGNNMFADRIDVPNYTSEIHGELATTALASDSVAKGVKLGGDTDTAGGAAPPSAPLTAAAGAYSSQVPYLNINFLIKT